jgi:hypothetical protein
VDLESAAVELYGASPDEFVSRRTALAAEARAARDRPLAKAIGQLRRPTRSAWLVNLLVRESPGEVTDLLELGAELQEAQRQRSGPDLRRLSQQRQAALNALTRRAGALATEHGHAATDASLQEVSQTLQAALADRSIAALVRIGRVVQPASYGGFGPMEFPVDAAAEPISATAEDATRQQADEATRQQADEATRQQADEATRQEAEDPARNRAKEAVQQANQELERAKQEAALAEADADQATVAADDCADRVERLRAQLQEAESSERAAADAARAARKRYQQALQGVHSAQQAAAAAQQSLDALTGS